MPTLDRAIGPAAATLLVIGGIIGSGIFLTTGRMAAALPSPSLLMLAWIAGCLFAVFGALTYAEMTTMFPRSGGVYVFLREAFGPLTGFLYGWATLLVVLSGGTAAVAAMIESGQLPMPKRHRGRGLSARDLRGFRRTSRLMRQVASSIGLRKGGRGARGTSSTMITQN